MDCLTLKKSNCKNCHKCVRHCPVKSIRFTGNQAYIVGNECILCGQCFVVCPQDAKQIVDETEKVKVLLSSGDPVVVSLAPSFKANFRRYGLESLREGLKKLGFYDVEETAIGATLVKREYEKMIEAQEKDIIITSCCHSANLLIQKYFPNELPYLADVLSPMQAHCQDIKKRIPNAKTVFIGPCVAKKDEAQKSGDLVDAVLTFDELSAWLMAEHVRLEPKEDETKEGRARLFPTPAGVLRSMDLVEGAYSYMAVDGAARCIEVLKDIEKGNLHRCFIEMNICTGSCVGGPVMEKHRNSPATNFVEIDRFAGKNDFDVPQPTSEELHKNFEVIDLQAPVPTEEQIKAVLKQMGKTKPADELNCGTCGYDSCRAKAIAVCQGKAEITMCLPYLKDKAESLSDMMSSISPNAVMMLNENLEVQELNKAALKMLHLRQASDILGDQVVRVLDPTDFAEVLATGRDIHNRKVFLAEYGIYVDETIVYDNDFHMLLAIMSDVTEAEEERAHREFVNQQTIETADRVVDRQMRIVQEIASLLGETAAETKIALSKLKESIKDDK